MVPFDNFNGILHKGFESGLLYILRYAEEEYSQLLNDDDIMRLSCHLAEKKPWKTEAEWKEFLSNLK